MDKEQMPEQAELNKAFQRQAAELQLTLNTKGWSEIVEPLLDKMIEDCIGAKRDGRWDSGNFNPQKQNGLSPEQLAWYRQGLIDFQNRIMDVLDAGAAAKERDKFNAMMTPATDVIVPMTQGSYAGNEENKQIGGEGYSSYVPDPDSDGGIQN